MRYTYTQTGDRLTRQRNERALAALEDRHIDPTSAGADLSWLGDDFSDFDEPEPWDLFIGEEADSLPLLA